MIELTIRFSDDTLAKLAELCERYRDRCGINLDDSTIIAAAIDFFSDNL